MIDTNPLTQKECDNVINVLELYSYELVEKEHYQSAKFIHKLLKQIKPKLEMNY